MLSQRLALGVQPLIRSQQAEETESADQKNQ